jgi:hypothetical protein
MGRSFRWFGKGVKKRAGDIVFETQVDVFGAIS